MTGVYRLSELQHLGLDRDAVTQQVEAGTLHRVARGWYATEGASRLAVSAVRKRARVGCLPACKEYGLWTPAHEEHLIYPRSAGRPTRRDHWAKGPLPQGILFPVEDALFQVLWHHDAETALMVLESAVDKSLITVSAAWSLIAAAPKGKWRTLSFFDPGAGSGTETRVRLWLQQRRFPVETQVTIAGVGRTDLRVGRSLIVECDSTAHHSDPEEDRRRDLAARALGYDSLRLSYRQIMVDWEEIQAALTTLLRTRRHLEPPIPLGTQHPRKHR